MSDRSCGSCTACCRWMGVPEIEKPQRAWCEHCEIGSGCRIYGDRPESCQKFACSYLLGPELFTEDDRPDKLRAIFWTTKSAYGPAIGVMEMAAGALEKPRVRHLTELLGKRVGVAVLHPIHGMKRTAIYDAGLVARAVEAREALGLGKAR